MAVFAGVQTGEADPTMRHETDQVTAPTETYVFTGADPKSAADPVPTVLLKPARPSEV